MELLDLPTNQFLTEKAIKKKYHEKARIYHPDTTQFEIYKNGEMFNEINTAENFLRIHMVAINENILNVEDYAKNREKIENEANIKKTYIKCPFCGAKNDSSREFCECCMTSLVSKEEEKENSKIEDNIKNKEEKSNPFFDFLSKYIIWILSTISIIFGVVGIISCSFISIFGFVFGAIGIIINNYRLSRDIALPFDILGTVISFFGTVYWFIMAIIIIYGK